MAERLSVMSFFSFVRAVGFATSVCVASVAYPQTSVSLWQQYGYPHRSDLSPEHQISEYAATANAESEVLDYFTYSASDLSDLAAILARSALVRDHVCKDIPAPSIESIEDFKQQNPKRFGLKERLDLSQIFIRIDSSDTSQTIQNAETLARDILKQIDGGASFRQLAYTYSESAISSLRGGTVGTVSRGQLDSEIDRVIFSLEEGETSGPIRSKNGFHIFRVQKKTPPPTPSDINELVVQTMQDQECAKRRNDVLARAKVAFRSENHFPCVPGTGVWLALDTGSSYPCSVAELYLRYRGFQLTDFETADSELEISDLTDMALLSARYVHSFKSQYDGIEPQLINLFKAHVISTLYWQMQFETLEPSPTDIREHAKRFPDLTQPEKLYSGKVIRFHFADPQKAASLSVMARHRMLQPLLQRIQELRKTQPQIDLEELTKLVDNNTTATVTVLDNEPATGPDFEVLVARTRPGSVSEPFEDRSGILLLQLDAITTRPVAADTQNQILEESWKHHTIQQAKEKMFGTFSDAQ